MSDNLTGLFGKLPAHGDFVFRDLPPRFINVWDEWLQGYVGSSQEQLGDSWLDVYLTSPVWRFALGEGVVDDNAWAGIMLPSCDRVGRYFPFSVLTRLPGSTNPVDFVCTRPNWYQAMEDAALRALDGHIQIDELIEELNDSNPMKKAHYRPGQALNGASRMVVQLPGADPSPMSALPFMMDAWLKPALTSYSVWSTRGSELIAPCVFTCQGLPALGGISAMMDGQWQGWSWQEPYELHQDL